ncbi:MAG TPA: ATP-binding protein [Candidatus Marinimicrobia bacterium]|nr:ATP-binding protein [Candidatus Neomarinimicrobiota bacterium]HQQ86298.1 ATP-binding protein [Candidatus Neomarinimicrobiota bacterium]
MIYQRKISKSLREHLSLRQITVITGMRRTGKTTLVKQILSEVNSENKLYIDFERFDERELFMEKNYENIIYALSQRGLDFSQKVWLALDEIQNVPNLDSVIKYLYDKYNIKFILTGSCSFYLKNRVTESLAGRKKIFELFTLDFGEFLTFKEVPFQSGDWKKLNFNASEYERLKMYYDEFVEYGGFPEVVLTKNVFEKRDLVQDILSSYINVDVRTLSDFRDIHNLERLIKLLGTRAGSRIDYSKLAILSGISRPTLYNYLNFLEKTYIIWQMPVLTHNPDREIVKANKLFFHDNGILNALSAVSEGVKFENTVFNQLKHWGELRYYSLKNGREIDFILNGEIAFEAKVSPTAIDLKTLAHIAENLQINQYRLIGKHPTPNFSNFIWAGEIR